MSTACVLLADGFEEIEAISVIDVLRRAEVDTCIVGVTSRDVRGGHDIYVKADRLLAEVQDRAWDVVVLPGGLVGARHLRDDAAVQALLVRQAARGARVAAICAAPIALERAGVLRDRTVTSYPEFKEELSSAAAYVEDDVVVDGSLTTSRGPSTALSFALTLVAQLCGQANADRLAKAMLFTR